MKTKWENIKIESERNSQRSKPEILAIREILEDKSNLTIASISEILKRDYTEEEVSDRQIRYAINLMETNKMVKSVLNGTEKSYSLVDPFENIVSPISINEALLSVGGLLLYFKLQDTMSLAFFLGIMITLMFRQFEYANSIIDYKKYLSKVVYKLMKKEIPKDSKTKIDTIL